MTLPPQLILDLVKKYGTHSHSFLTCYGGYHYLPLKDSSSQEVRGIIPYLQTRTAWVGACNPIADIRDHNQILKEFFEGAIQEKKTAILIAVNEETAKKAQLAGYKSLRMGLEPLFFMDQYPPPGRTWQSVQTARLLAQKGAKVVECGSDQETLAPILSDWLAGQKVEALNFLSAVEPWTLADHKRFFRVDYQGQTLAFCVAIPFPAREGWYLNDVIRRQNAPTGATELLILGAMKILKEGGAKTISLGIISLAGLEEKDPDHIMLGKVLRFAYDRTSLLLNIKTLHDFKIKFFPSVQEPVYLVYRTPTGGHLRIRDILSIVKTFTGAGLVRTVFSRSGRSYSQFKFHRWYLGFLNAVLVPRSAPLNLGGFLYRIKWTLLIALLCLFAFSMENGVSGVLSGHAADRFAFSWRVLLEMNWLAVLFSPFLHETWAHLLSNLFILFLFVGGLEYLVGSVIMVGCFLFASFLANPLTVALLYFPLKLHLGSWLKLFYEKDVGISLGIFGCAGALSLLIKGGPRLIWGLILVTLIGTAITGRVLWLNHLIAVFLGMLPVAIWLRDYTSPRLFRWSRFPDKKRTRP